MFTQSFRVLLRDQLKFRVLTYIPAEVVKTRIKLILWNEPDLTFLFHFQGLLFPLHFVLILYFCIPFLARCSVILFILPPKVAFL